MRLRRRQRGRMHLGAFADQFRQTGQSIGFADAIVDVVIETNAQFTGGDGKGEA